MAKEYARTQRVAEQMQRELAELVQRELKDPRIGLVTLTGVEVSTDYSHAKVFFTLMADPETIAETRKALGHAAGFLRRELGRRMKLRMVPQLHFLHDESVERGIYLSHLIDAAVADDVARETDAGEAAAE